MAIGSRIYCSRKTSEQDVDARVLKQSLYSGHRYPERAETIVLLNASNRRTISPRQLDLDVRNSMYSLLNNWSMKRTLKVGTQVRVCRRCY